MPTIHFRGPVLYAFEPGTTTLAEILMPRVRDQGGPATPHGGSGHKHADDTPAYDHYTGVLYKQSGSDAWCEDLAGDIRVDELDARGNVVTGGCATTAAFRQTLPMLDRIANDPADPARHLKRLTPADGAATYWKRVAAVAALRSGTMDCGKTGDTRFAFPVDCTFDPTSAANQHFLLDGAWTPSDPSHQVRVRCTNDRGETLDRTLSPGDEMYFYTFDRSRPDKWQLLEEKQAGTIGFVDVDFKWVYQVVKAPGDDARRWAKQTGCRHLPAPAIIAAPLAPDVSTCYPAGWTGA